MTKLTLLLGAIWLIISASARLCAQSPLTPEQQEELRRLQEESKPVVDLREHSLESVRGKELRYRRLEKFNPGGPNETSRWEQIVIHFVDENRYLFQRQGEDEDDLSKATVYYPGSGPIITDSVSSSGRRHIHLVSSYRDSLHKFLPIAVGIFGSKTLLGARRTEKPGEFENPGPNLSYLFQLNDDNTRVTVTNSRGQLRHEWIGSANYLEPNDFTYRIYDTKTGEIRFERQWQFLGSRNLEESEMEISHFEFKFEPGLFVTDWTKGAPISIKSDELLKGLENPPTPK
ncbi:MAG: hypothetical protein HRU46_21395 [Verrucomicrobiales bacterium]|nr:hypothetical protein [Verrucomicrobiales bacterium]